MFKPFLILGLTGILIYVSQQWGYSQCETRHQKAVLAAAEAVEQERKDFKARIEGLEKEARTASHRGLKRHEKDQRIIRQLADKVGDLNSDLDVYLELDILLDRAVCDSELPSRTDPVCDGAYLPASHVERVSYLREVIEGYQQEGLRCNTMRAALSQ